MKNVDLYSNLLAQTGALYDHSKLLLHTSTIHRGEAQRGQFLSQKWVNLGEQKLPRNKTA